MILHHFADFNSFVPNVPFLQPLKTSEKVFWRFQRIQKGCIGNKWVDLFRGNASFYSNCCIILENIKKTTTGLANIYLFKVSNRNTRKSCEICSKSIIKTTERLHNVVLIVNSEHVSHLFLKFLLLILNKQMIIGMK